MVRIGEELQIKEFDLSIPTFMAHKSLIEESNLSVSTFYELLEIENGRCQRPRGVWKCQLF